MEYLATLGRAHVVLLHLPFGLLASVVVLELLTLRPAGAALRPALRTLLWISFVAAAIAAASGFLLSREPGYTSPVVERHMWLGIAFAVLVLATAALYELFLKRAHRAVAARSDGHPVTAEIPSAAAALGYRVALLASVGLLMAAGHLGGTLTHGENFLFEPLLARGGERGPAGNPSAAAAGGSAPDMFEATVRPVFESRCYACHGPTRARGKLTLHTPAGIRAGGESGPVIVAGDPAASELLRRLRLPLDDPDHMPPEGKPQPDPQEIAAIEAWIAAGAPLGSARPE